MLFIKVYVDGANICSLFMVCSLKAITALVKCWFNVLIATDTRERVLTLCGLNCRFGPTNESRSTFH